jgi:thiol-disulfide isomerase/thioredoxin
MATRRKMKSRKSGYGKKRFSRRHRPSVAGKIMPPLDVRSKSHLSEFKKRIQKGPLTIIMVYADWCSHCHTMMPPFDEASKSPKRSIQSIKLNEQMLPHVNEFVNRNINSSAKPINVEGYPSIILVDNKGNKVTDIEPVRDTKTMSQVMEKSASIANNAGLNMELNEIKAQNTNVGEEEMKGSFTQSEVSNNASKSKNNNMKPKNSIVNIQEVPSTLSNMETNEILNKMTKPVNNTRPKSNIKEEAEEVTSLVAPISPPLINSDIENTENPQNPSFNTISGGGRRGGSLMSALARTTYTLAPAAALMATAALVMKRKNHNVTHKRFKKHRKTHRHRR